MATKFETYRAESRYKRQPLNSSSKLKTLDQLLNEARAVKEQRALEEQYRFDVNNQQKALDEQRFAEEQQQQEQNNELKWHQKIIPTIQETFGRVGEGVGSSLEALSDDKLNLADTIQYNLLKAKSGFYDILGNKSKANMYDIQANAINDPVSLNKPSSIPDEKMFNVGVQLEESSKTYANKYDQASYLKSTGEQVATGVGNMLPSIALGMISGGAPLGLTTLGMQAFGSSSEQALEEGANVNQATAYGLLSSAKEVITEKLVGGGLGKLTGYTGLLDNAIAKTVSSKLGKVAIDILGEGLEEALAEGLEPAIKTITYDKNALDDYSKKDYWEGVLQSAIVGSLTGAVFDGANLVIRKGTNADVKDIMAEYDNLEKTSQALIADNKMNDLESKNIMALKKDLQSQLESKLNKMSFTQRLNFIGKNQDNQLVLEYANKNDGFGVNKGTYTSKPLSDQQLGKNVVSEPTTEAVETATTQETTPTIAEEPIKVVEKEKVLETPKVDLESNPKIKEANALYDKIKQVNPNVPKLVYDDKVGNNINGYFNKKTNTLVINPNVEKPATAILKHEIAHSLEGTIYYKKLQDHAIKYLKSKGEYDALVKEITENYSEQIKTLTGQELQDYIDTEVISHFSERLFSDQDSVNQLVKDNRSLAKKIYDFIKGLIAKISGNTTEKAELQRIEGMYKKALEENKTSKPTEVKKETKVVKEEPISKELEKEMEEAFLQELEEEAKEEQTIKEDLEKEVVAKKVETKPIQPKNIDDINGIKQPVYKTKTKEEVAQDKWLKEQGKKALKNVKVDDNPRFSLAGNNLVAIHNLNEDELNKTLDLGGFPMPSIAITKVTLPHENYGSISVLFDKNTIDPRRSENKVYDRDAWTPTIPNIENKLNDKSVENVIKELSNLTKEYGVYSNEANRFFDGHFRNSSGEYVIPDREFNKSSIGNLAYQNEGILASYLAEKGIDIEPVFAEKKYAMGFQTFNRTDAKEMLDIVGITKDTSRDTITDEQIDTMFEKYIQYKAKALYNFLKKRKPEYTLSEAYNVAKKENNEGQIYSLLFLAEDFYNDKNTKQTYDNYSTRDKLRASIESKDDFYEWIWSKIKPTFEIKGIDNDADLFTPSGNRRRFEQRHYDFTLNNIVKAMKKDTQKGKSTFGITAGSLSAKLAKQFESIDDIREAQDILKLVGEEELKEFNDKCYELYDEVVDEISGVENDTFSYISRRDDIGNIIGECATVSPLTVENITKKFNAETKGYNLNYKFNRAIAEKVLSLFEVMKHVPTTYFEAKPKRAVGLEEIKLVLLPENTNEDLVNKLKEKSIPYEFYDENRTRQAIIQEQDSIKFSLNPKTKETKFQNTLLDAQYENLSQETTDRLETEKALYETSTNKDLVDKAQEQLKGKRTSTQVDLMIKKLSNPKEFISKDDIAIIEQLILEADKKGFYEETADLGRLLSQRASEMGQSIQALSIIQRLSPNGRLLTYNKIVEKSNADIKANKPNYTNNKMFKSISKERIEKWFNADLRLIKLKAVQRLVSNHEGVLLTNEERIRLSNLTHTSNSYETNVKEIISKYEKDTKIVDSITKEFIEDVKTSEEKLKDNYETKPVLIPVFLADRLTNAKTDLELTQTMKEIDAVIQSQELASFWDKVNNYRYLSMLGNAKTHIRNIVSNSVMKEVVDAKSLLSRLIQTTFIKKTNRTRTFTRTSNEMLEYGQEMYDTAVDEIQSGSKFYEARSKKQIFRNKILESARKFNFLMLSKEDLWFIKPRFSKEFGEWATAKGYTTDFLKQNDEIRTQGVAYAMEQAQKATFNDTCKLVTRLNALKSTNRLVGVLVDAVLPFTKTPINIARRAIEYSPIGLVKSLSVDIVKLRKGELNVSSFIENISSGLVGSGITVLGLFLAKLGIMSAGDDENKKKGAYDQTIGEQSFSIKILDKTYSLDWLAPSSIPLFMGVSLYNAVKNKDENDFYGAIGTMLSALDPMTEMTVLRSFNSAMSTYDDSKLYGFVSNAMQSYAAQFLPTLGSQIAKIVDDTRRTTASTNQGVYTRNMERFWNYLQSKVPFFATDLEPYIDVWGNEDKNPSWEMRLLENTVFPFYVEKIKSNNPVDLEIMRLYEVLGTTDVLPSSPKNYYTKEKVYLNDSEYTQFKKDVGQFSKQQINALIKSSLYNSLSDEEKADAISRVYDYARDYAKKQNTYLLSTVLGESNSNLISTFQLQLDTISSKTDEFGNVIVNSKKNQIMAYINALPLSKIQKHLLFAEAGYKNSTDIDLVKSFINGLSNLSKEQKEQLFQMFDYD